MKKVAGPLRINLAQYRELEAFSQFGSELDPETLRQLRRGERLIEVLKQPQYMPLPVNEQVIMLYVANKEVLSDLDKEDIKDFMHDFIVFLKKSHPVILETIETTGQFTDATANATDAAIAEFRETWQPEHEVEGLD